MLQLPSTVKVQPVGFKYFDGGGDVQMVYKQSESLDRAKLPPDILNAVKEIERLRGKTAIFVMINKVPPGVAIARHTDTLRSLHNLERWHLPLLTNPDCWFWDEGNGKFSMASGSWHGPVPYWKLHSAGNDGKTDRIHLVVDLETGGCAVPESDIFFKKQELPPIKSVLKKDPPVKTPTQIETLPPDKAPKVIDLKVENKIDLSSSGG